VKDLGAAKVVLESDCLGMIKKPRSKELDRLVHGPLVEDIKIALRGFDEIRVHHVRRSANEVANR
jgi:hypothetical protein